VAAADLGVVGRGLTGRGDVGREEFRATTKEDLAFGDLGVEGREAVLKCGGLSSKGIVKKLESGSSF
jgi:hypothetical protein